MAAERGSAFLLKIGDGAATPTFATVAGLKTTQLSINGDAVAITNKGSGGWRELLSGAGVRFRQLPGQRDADRAHRNVDRALGETRDDAAVCQGDVRERRVVGEHGNDRLAPARVGDAGRLMRSELDELAALVRTAIEDRHLMSSLHEIRRHG